MNDVENKLRQLQFPRPPESLRSELIAAISPSPRSGLRDWLWPSPSAWAAVAAAWMIMALLQMSQREASRENLSIATKQQIIRYAALMQQSQSLTSQP